MLRTEVDELTCSMNSKTLSMSASTSSLFVINPTLLRQSVPKRTKCASGLIAPVGMWAGNLYSIVMYNGRISLKQGFAATLPNNSRRFFRSGS